MTNQDWTPAIGLRKAALSLTWRTVVAAVMWCALLWVFHAALSGIGVTRVPMLIALGFAAMAGTIAGLILSRGLEEIAGFVSPLLTLLALAFAALGWFTGPLLWALAGVSLILAVRNELLIRRGQGLLDPLV